MLKGKTVLLGVSGSIAAIQDRIACQCIKEAGRRCACADDAECHELYQSDHV